MVSILIVSHSKEVARGCKKIAEQMVQGEVSLAAVGGTKDGRIGTDPDLIKEALEKLDNEEGVVILVDLGSAIMNVEMSIEFFASDSQKKFKIANAPLVEGALSAVIGASAGRNIEDILKLIEEEENFSQKINR